MLASREGECGLTGLLDRALYKGLVLQADVIITVAGIPLIGLNLRAVLASVDTMIAHGIWVEWDQALRAVATEEERRKEQESTRFLSGETPLFRSTCSLWQDAGLIRSWVPATLYLTESRVLVIRKEPLALLWESALDDIRGCSLCESETAAGSMTPTLVLHARSGTVHSLLVPDPAGFAGMLGAEMKRKGLPWSGLPGAPPAAAARQGAPAPGSPLTDSLLTDSPVPGTPVPAIPTEPGRRIA